MATYLHLHRIHLRESSCDLIDTFIELDERRRESRKVEIRRDGGFGYADAVTAFGGSVLAADPWPADEDIARDPLLMLSAMPRSGFDSWWAEAIRLRG